MPRSRKKTPEVPTIPEVTTPEEVGSPEASEPDEPEEVGPKVVSLGRELSALNLTLRGAQLLTDTGLYGYLDVGGQGDVFHCVSATLSFLGARMGLLQGVIRREVNPAFLWAPHNAVAAHESRDDGDLFLTEWKPSIAH
ncbi:hypothetical protein [Cystobacter ferrugineus]|uniref:Uncharacterized protein n=1 Tax=Cystobacter ferrugineus TaxID=83449 RepID=A0A1L9AU71_9BACT|nr:hypothetical protein [Cystobacter ferrugineus]OJH33560.1 hypothetical protein BON30_48080 [Cystobacter ferrugineus]